MAHVFVVPSCQLAAITFASLSSNCPLPQTSLSLLFPATQVGMELVCTSVETTQMDLTQQMSITSTTSTTFCVVMVSEGSENVTLREKRHKCCFFMDLWHHFRLSLSSYSDSVHSDGGQ